VKAAIETKKGNVIKMAFEMLSGRDATEYIISPNEMVAIIDL